MLYNKNKIAELLEDYSVNFLLFKENSAIIFRRYFMNNATKKMLALLLALCTLISVAMPTVFATGDGDQSQTPEGAAPATPKSVDYLFYREDLTGFVREKAAGIKAAYDNGTGNWRIEASDVPGQYRLATDEGQTKDGNNRFQADTKSLQYFTGASSGSWQRFFAVRIQSPGSGKFDLTYTYGTGSQGAEKGSVYIVDAAVIDNELGEKSAAYAEALAQDMYQGGAYKTGIYNEYHTLMKAVVKANKSVITDINYYTEKVSAGNTVMGQYTFEANKEYVVIFTSDKAGPSGNGTLFISGLNVTEQVVTTESTEYAFYTAELSGKSIRTEAAAIKAAFDNATGNWRVEASDVPGQYRLATDEGQTKDGNNRFATDTKSLQYFTGASSGSWQRFFAVRIKSPGSGRFDLTYTYGTGSQGAEKGSVYIVDAAVIDNKLDGKSAAYAEALAQDMYQGGVYKTGIYAEYHALMKEVVKANKSVMTDINYYSEKAATGLTAEGQYYFASGKEYVVIFTSDIAGPSGNGTLFISGLTAVYSENQEQEPEDPTEPEAPEIPDGPGYTDGLYDFYQGRTAGSTLADGIDTLAAMYNAGSINWKYETKGGNLNLEKVTYEAKTNSMRAISAPEWWLAFRIKAPAQDGQYSIKMTHGASGSGAQSGSIFVIPGNTETKDIFRVASQKGAAMTTDWFYGETTSDTFKGRESTTGTVNLKAGEEYIVVFLPTSTNKFNGNGFFYPGQLQVTRTGEYVEDSTAGTNGDLVEYEFYDWDNPGQFLIHYRTEEELNRKIVTEKIAQEYANGTRNWCYTKSNGFAQFSTGTPYMQVTIGETQYFCIKIKSPGTGTYEITYNHLALKDTTAALRGSIYILPYKEGVEYATYRDEANFADAVISTEYYAEKTEIKKTTGTYTAFEEGKEYLVCFSVEDNDNTKNLSIKCYPQSLVMKRTGDYVPISAGGADDGIVYNLFQEKYANKWLTARAEDEYVMDVIAKEYEAGRTNWKYEGMSGSAKFFGKYLRAGVGKEGAAFGIRIQSPGTGNYKITLKYMKGFEPSAADIGEVYIMEAPEKTIPGSEIKYYLAGEPVMELDFSCSGTRFQKATEDGTFMFQEGKEYIVLVYGADSADNTNTTGNTYMFLDRLVMKRIGEYVEKEKVLNEGGIVAENVLTQFKSEAYMLTTVNDHDYLVFGLTGGTMLIYDLDEWRLVDEVQIGISTPRAMCEDLDGNWWITGTSQALYCYNPYTREGYMTGKISGGGDNFHIACDPEDGSIYFASYAAKGILLYRVNPRTLEVQKWNMEDWSRYPGPGSCMVIGDYLYISASSGDRCEIWKVNKHNGTIVDRVDIFHRTKAERYVYYMSPMGENHLLVYSALGVLVVDTRDMSLLYGDAVGLDGTSSRIASEPIDGKCYFVTNAEGLCYFDLETETFGTVGGELANYKTGLRVSNLATIDDSRLTEKTMIAFGGMSASGVSLYAINLETKISVELIGLVEPGMGTGVNAHTIFKGEPGTNEIIYGPMYPDFPARVYNAATGELAREFKTNGQNDSYVWYNGKMYFGNYNGAALTEMNNGKATMLFTLNDKNFDQSRIHGICGGDNKVFIGTIPDNFKYGGVIAWYDLETELTYVVTGPNPEDVYYAKASKTTVTNEWYSVVTGELVNMAEEWDRDNDGDGVNDSFAGPVPRQSIVKVVYSDGLLYGVSTLRAGSGLEDTPNATAVIFIYDVENMKMLKTVDLANYIQGVPSTVRIIQSLEADPEISNKMWGMVAETLFSMTYNKETNKVTIKEEISFNKTRINQTTSLCTPMIFDGDYLYALFGSVGGLLKINRNDTSDYVRLMGDFETTRQVPTDFILGDDGDIYYVSSNSPHIYVLNVDITDEERASAKVVDDAIDLIPDVVTLADRATIEAARAAWDAMPKANQPLVKNLERLEQAEIALLTLRIDALSENITIEDEPELLAIRAEYMALDLEQRLFIDFRKVSDAESKMSILRGERTTNLINSIGEVTLDKEQLIRDARASFMALTRYERTLVKNIDTLNAAEAVLTGLLLRKSEASAVDKLIEKIGFVFYGDGAKISAARKAYNKLDDATQEWVEKYGILVASEIILVVEYLIAAAVVTGGVLYAIPATRAKIFKKKEKATEE